MKYLQAKTALAEFLNSEQITKDFPRTDISLPFDLCHELIDKRPPEIPKATNGEFSHMSGLYFLCSADDEIYYIGKATKNNLHEEIWGKIKTPTRLENNKLIYPKNYFLNKGLDDEAISNVINGKIKLRVIGLSNPILASLAEVYIQTIFYQINGSKLPKLNSRIG